MEVWPAQMMVKVLKEEGITCSFGVHGGHTMPLDDWFCMEGGKYYHMRHEQAGVYAADAYARCTRRPGLAFGTSGPGVANMVPAIGQAYTSRSPVICFFGQHPLLGDRRWTLQEGYGVELVRSITKSAERIVDPNMASFYLKRAIRTAMTYPQGPVAVEIPLDVLNWRPVESTMQFGYTPDWLKREEPLIAGQPDLIEELVDMLLKAERPVLVVGEGIHWAKAENALKEFVELTQIPVHTRRIARGAVSEEHPLHIGGGFRGRFLKGADLIVVIGLRMGYLEGYGAWNDTAKFVQINESPDEICFERPTDLMIIGNCKLVLEQMLKCAKNNSSVVKRREAWLQMIDEGRSQFNKKVEQKVQNALGEVPIHPDAIGNEMAEFINEAVPDATIIFDSYTGTNYFTDKLTARYSGQIIDAGEWAGVGHGMGFAVGAQAARPGKPVISYIGDGGMGIGGFDIETCARYDLPVVFVLYNDGVWIAGEKKFAYGENWKTLGPQNSHGRDNDKGERYRYDKMFAEFGCHVEHVRETSQIKSALDRSFNSGKTSVVNVETSPDVHVSMFYRPDWACMFWHIPKDSWYGDPEAYKLMNDTFKNFHGRDLPSVPRNV